MSRRVRTAWGRMVACRPMPALVPLLTSAALALAGWLATGIVTVRSLDEPARIGLLGAPATLLLFFLPLLALSAVGARAARPWRSLARTALLGLPVVLPWLPLPLTPALLVWTGPLAVGWWLAMIAYVYADACAVLARPIQGLVASPTRAPLVAGLVTGVALVATAWHTAPQHPRGDEPDYLIIAQSLWLDGDLQIENNHTRADYAAYHATVLPPSYLARGRNGAIYSVHAPGLPVLLVPGVALAGYGGAVATMVLLAMIGAWLAWQVSWAVTQDVHASWLGTLATVGAAPFFLHGAAIFPDAPASLLTLVALWALVTTRPGRRGLVLAALALGLLPWLHTRYALLSVGLGAAFVARLAWRRDVRALVAFVAPAAVLAVAWFGFFVAVYGTPSPSAPYGAYTQMALAHLRPGVPGLLFDQQFGLLASAPVLLVALVSLRPAVRQGAPRIWSVALTVIALGVAYTCVVGAYRMWWGGLSAPARFLAPLVLPLAPWIALGWQSLRTRTSRHAVVGLLLVSLALTALLVVVEQGALAYNTRDGRAQWAVWVSPLVDLVAALPAAHRDAPGVVLRDVAIWAISAAAVWGLWRRLERRGRLDGFVSLLSVAVAVPAASAAIWTARDVSGLAPEHSQVRYLEARAAAASPWLVTISPPPRGRTRAWFEVDLEGRRQRGASDYTVLRLDRLPAGRYRVCTDVTGPGARLGVTLGEGRATRFLMDLDASTARCSPPFDLALPVAGLVVKGSWEAAIAHGRTWLVADAVRVPSPARVTTQAAPLGAGVWLFPETGIYAEPDGAWLAGDSDATIGLPSSAPVAVSLRAGAADVVVTWSGAGEEEIRLAAGETRLVTLRPEQGRVRLRTRGGFRPAQVSPGNGDQRYLAAWIAAR